MLVLVSLIFLCVIANPKLLGGGEEDCLWKGVNVEFRRHAELYGDRQQFMNIPKKCRHKPTYKWTNTASFLGDPKRGSTENQSSGQRFIKSQ